jgi:hypothetical protein
MTTTTVRRMSQVSSSHPSALGGGTTLPIDPDYDEHSPLDGDVMKKFSSAETATFHALYPFLSFLMVFAGLLPRSRSKSIELAVTAVTGLLMVVTGALPWTVSIYLVFGVGYLVGAVVVCGLAISNHIVLLYFVRKYSLLSGFFSASFERFNAKKNIARLEKYVSLVIVAMSLCVTGVGLILVSLCHLDSRAHRLWLYILMGVCSPFWAISFTLFPCLWFLSGYFFSLEATSIMKRVLNGKHGLTPIESFAVIFFNLI